MITNVFCHFLWFTLTVYMTNLIWKKRKALLAIQADRLHMNSIGLHRILRKLISVVFSIPNT